VLRVEVRGQRGPVVVVGQTPRATPGEFVEATGKWVEDPEFGRQFKADTLRIVPPSTAGGIEKYLGSGFCFAVHGQLEDLWTLVITWEMTLNHPLLVCPPTSDFSTHSPSIRTRSVQTTSPDARRL